MNLRGCRWFIVAIRILVCVACCVLPAQAQSHSEKGEECRDNITEDAGFKFREVKVKARYLPDLKHPLPAPGTTYSPATVTTIVQDVSQALTNEALRENEEGQTEHKLLNTVTVGNGRVSDAFGFGIKFVTSCTKTVSESDCRNSLGGANSQCVDVEINAFSVRVNTGDPISNLLNIPRSNRPSFLSKVPGPLLALNPKVGVEHDRGFGPSAVFDTSTNLLDLSRNLRSLPLHGRKIRLDFRSTGRRSLDGPFYETVSKLSFSRGFANAFERLALDLDFEADHYPAGQGEFLKNALRIGGNVRLRTHSTLFEAVSFNAHYRWSSNRLNAENPLFSEATRENAFEGSALLDGRLWNGTSRLALWVETNSPNRLVDNYQRAAAIWGYQKEFLVVPNQTIGIEVLAGGGRAWGNTPQYARFYGGNWAKNFIYEAKDAPVLSLFPRGPLLRSFGSGRAIVNEGTPGGATSYWHFNLNVNIPVPKWSSPIVPDISISLPKKDPQGKIILDENQEPVMEDKPLRVILKNQGESSRKVLERLFVKDGLSEAEAQAKARRELRSINSILGFMADQANIYSFKPLFMFDAARLNSLDAINNRTKFAVGGGLQFTLVIAKFEAGYVRTLRPLPGDDKGNVVLRLFFQNMF
jgi:hypothetical protein